ncbi:hypothetical protein Tco_1306780 [Tanacetum coccineum]
MDNIRAQQKALDDELVTPTNRLKIGKSYLRLSSNLKFKEPTLQVVLNALKLIPFYKAFEITTDVPEIYIQEFWVTVSRHHSLLRFKLNGKNHTVNIDNFRDMLKIYPKFPGQIFEEPPLKEEILSFIRDLGHTDEIKFLSDVNDQAIPRRNKMFWHYARDEFMFTTIRVISKHQNTQVYGAILPQHLTNQAMLESEAYMTYHAYATGEKTPKPKSTKKKANFESSPKTKLTQASKGKRIKTIAKGDKPAKKKQTVTKSKGADEGTGSIPGVLDVPTYESDNDQISWKLSEEDDDDEVNASEEDDDDNRYDDDGNNDDDDDDDADNQDAENEDDDDEQIDSDNNGDDFVHPKFSTHDEEDKEEDSFDPRVQTPSHVESTDDEDSDEEIQDANVKGDKMNEEEKNEEAEVDALYTDMNVNLEGSDSEMTDAPRNII